MTKGPTTAQLAEIAQEEALLMSDADLVKLFKEQKIDPAAFYAQLEAQVRQRLDSKKF